MDKYRITLSPEERIGLEKLVSTGKGAARKLAHARILLLADSSPGTLRTDDDIVAALGLGSRTIARVRKLRHREELVSCSCTSPPAR